MKAHTCRRCRCTWTSSFSRQVRLLRVRVHVITGRSDAFPAGVVALFFGANTLLEGKSVDDAKERISEAYVPTLVRNWYVLSFASYPTLLTPA